MHAESLAVASHSLGSLWPFALVHASHGYGWELGMLQARELHRASSSPDDIQVVAMDVPPSVIVSGVRRQLANNLGFEENGVCLMLRGIELDPHKALRDYVNVSGETLQLVPVAKHQSAVDDNPNSSDSKESGIRAVRTINI